MNFQPQNHDALSATAPLDEAVWESLRELQEAGEPDDLLGELIDLFLTDTPNVCQAVREAIAAGDADGLRRAAHSGKGSSANLGALPLSDLFRELEDLGRSGTTVGGSELMPRVDAELGRVACALELEKAGV